MSEHRKIVLILGNGFDLDLGLGLNNLQIIKTGDIKEDKEKLFKFLFKHGKDELSVREFIGKLINH